MKQIESIDRDQIQMNSLDMLVEGDSLVRLIDVFLDFALTNDIGFKTHDQRTGRPSFPVRTLLGIYIYGYLNRIRSSRALEKACKVNIEMMWLIKGHRPCYKMTDCCEALKPVNLPRKGRNRIIRFGGVASYLITNNA